MSIHKNLGMIALVSTFLLAAGLLLSESVAGQESYSVGGDVVAVYNLAGEIEVVRGTGNDVVVEVTRGGPDADQLDVAIGEVRGHQALRVLYPDDNVIYDERGRGSTTVRVRDDGTFYGGGRGGDKVRVADRGRGLEAHADLRIMVPAGTEIRVYLAVGASQVHGLESDVTLDTGSGNVEVRDIVGTVNVDTGSGSVEIIGVEGSVYADTGSGSVEVEDVVGRHFVADTGSGSVTAIRVTVEEASVDTGSGRIRLEDLSAPEVVCDTGSGSVLVALLSDVDRLRVDTGSGSVTLRIPSDFGAELELDTGSGGIDLEVPAEASQVRRNYFRGVIGDGRGDVTVDTGSGGISIVANR